MVSVQTWGISVIVLAALSATPAEAAGWYKAFCSVSAGKRGEAEPVATTEVFDTDLSVDDITDHFQSFLYDASKGRVAVPFDSSRELHAHCRSGSEEVRQNYLNYYRRHQNRELLSIKSPLDARGYYRRNRTASATSPAKAPPPASPTPAPSPPPQPAGPTAGQLEYQRQLEAYQARLAEIEKIKADREATLASNDAALGRSKAEAEQALERHRQELARAADARRRYEQELAAHQATVDRLQTQQDRDRAVEWKEAVVVCTFNQSDGQSKFGNWRCDGPLQFTYAKLGQEGGSATGGALTALSQACGGRPESVRDLGLVSGYRLFGCSFGLHPKASSGFHLDAARKYGIEYVPGRASYRCPAWKSFCRTQ